MYSRFIIELNVEAGVMIAFYFEKTICEENNATSTNIFAIFTIKLIHHHIFF
jgi:hypothetical protein